MANIKPYVDAISQAVYGEEVRGAIINALIKVNDDNDSYKDLKQEVVDAKDKVEEAVAEFDGKVKDAEETEQRLSNTTSAAKSTQTELDNSIDVAGQAKTSIDRSTFAAGEQDTALNETIKNASTQDTSLHSTIDTAVMKNNALNDSMTAADKKKTALDDSTKAADTQNAALKQSITNADAQKTALDKSTGDAKAAKQNLDDSKSAADASKTSLDESIRLAGTTKEGLTSTVKEAATTKEQVQKVIESGNSVKTEIEAGIQTASQTIATLDSKNTEAGQNVSNLDNRNAAAVKNLSDLKDAEGRASEILIGVEDIKAYLGYPDTDIVGVQVDYKNKTFQRLAGAYGLNGGADFDNFEMFGGRRRCNLANDGTINAFFGDEGYAEDGSNGQVMVYQPKFYYKVVPLVLDPITDGIGYHLRKANYYVSTKPKDGFKLHPAFYDENGAEVDHIFLSAYKGSIYDVSASAYLLHDEQVADFNNDLFCSIAGVKPASGLSQNLTRPNIEAMAKRRGSGWHGDTIKAEAANQLLMIIEMGMMDLQSAIGQGVVSISDNSSFSCTSLTGSTSNLGNGTGRAVETINEINGVQNTYTNDGRTSVTYRGMENPWGNIWKFVYDVNFWGNGSMKGGVPYICKDFNFTENKKDGNYESAEFTLTNANGYISAIGYGNPDYDWLFFASECSGNSSLPVGDYTWVTSNLNGFRVAQLGGSWTSGGYAGAFYLDASNGVGNRFRNVGGRLVYIPKAA